MTAPRRRPDFSVLDEPTKHELLRSVLFDRRMWLGAAVPTAVTVIVVTILVVLFHESYPRISTIISFSLLVLSAAWLTFALRRAATAAATRELRRFGFCVKCGYDLRQSIADGREECPECGREIPPRSSNTAIGGD